MNFTDRLKGEQDIISLCESFSVDHNASLRKTNESIEAEGKGKDAGDDVFNPDDLFNTVDLPEDEPIENGPSFSADDITLSHEQKEEIKKALTSVLDEIQDKDSISEPALEMIVNEVANQTSYLSEADEANLEGPVEKQKFRVGLVEAIKKFISELLGVTVENDGEVPTDVDSVGGEAGVGAGEGAENAGESGEAGEAGEGKGEEAGEGQEPVDEEKKEGEVASLQEGADGSEATGDGSTATATEPESAVQEGVCTECGEESVVEVDPLDAIRVVDDNDPGVAAIGEPAVGDAAPVIAGEEGGIEGIPGAEGAEGGEGVSDDTPLTVGVLKQLVGQLLTESVEGEKSFAELWKNLAGNAVSLAKPGNTKGQEKTADPKGNPPDGTKYETPKAEAGNAVTLAKPGNAKGQEKTASPTAKAPEGTKYETPKLESGNDNSLPKPANTKGQEKTADPKGNPPKGTTYTTATPPKETAGGHVKQVTTPKEEAAKIAAAVLHEGKSKSAISFLKEAAEAVKNAKKSMNS
jgi:hypothetical protein